MNKGTRRSRRWSSVTALLLVSFAMVMAAGCKGAAEVEAPAGLTLETLRNGAYIGIYEEPVQLTDGKYEGEPFVGGGGSRPTVTLSDVHALGDLNGDGEDDAAVVLVESSGGSGSFRFLAVVLNQDGSPKSVATEPIGDREQVESVEIEGATITVEAKVHGPDDPLCCPTLPVTLTYVFEGDQLTKVGEEVSEAPPKEETPASIVFTRWTLTSLVDEGSQTVSVLPDTTVTAEFFDDVLVGNTGCNDYAASWETEGYTITVGPVGSAFTACEEPAGVMEQELDYFKALRAAASYRVEADTLTLMDADGNTLATFARAGEAPILDVVWQWTGVVEEGLADQSLVPDPEGIPPVDYPERYTLVLRANGTYEVVADCNTGDGRFTLAGSSLTLEPSAMVLVDCDPDSLYDIYLDLLDTVESATVVGGQLHLLLRDDGGVMTFHAGGMAGEPGE